MQNLNGIQAMELVLYLTVSNSTKSPQALMHLCLFSGRNAHNHKKLQILAIGEQIYLYMYFWNCVEKIRSPNIRAAAWLKILISINLTIKYFNLS